MAHVVGNPGFGSWELFGDTVDGRNHAPPEIDKDPANNGRFSISTVQDFFHEEYFRMLDL